MTGWTGVDGHYCDYRGAFIITHCDDQSEYLTYKVGLFNKAFPNTKPVSNIKNHTHAQGHKYNTWYVLIKTKIGRKV